jgi:hypothetical protein
MKHVKYFFLKCLDSLHRVSGFETNSDRELFQSPSTVSHEDSSSHSSCIVSKVHHQNLSTQDQLIIDPLYSPQQETFILPSPITPFSIPSHLSPISVSPTLLSPFPEPISSSINNIKPSSTSSSSSSSSTNPNPNVVSTDQTARKTSFNRSLPHSLVS